MAAAKKTQKKEKINKKASKPVTATKKSSPKSKRVSPKPANKEIKKESSKNKKFYDQLNLNESYVSLILGAVVVVGVSLLFVVFLKESRTPSLSESGVLNSSVSPVLTKTPEPAGQKYTVLENETLWDVAVKFYGDGFAYPRIIEANKTVITNPDFVPPGTVIIIPNAN